MKRNRLAYTATASLALAALALGPALPAGATVEPEPGPTTSTPPATVDPKDDAPAEPVPSAPPDLEEPPADDGVPADPGTVVPPELVDEAPPAVADEGTVSYRGVVVPVPVTWPVVDLVAEPRACVRADVHAVYVGTPGADQDCPPGLLGRVGTVLLQPVPDELPFGAVTVSPGRIPEPTRAQVTAGEVVGVVDGSDVLLRITLEPDGTLPDVGELVVTSEATPWTAPMLAQAGPSPLDRSVTWHHGLGFDACTAPSLDAMSAWRASPYGAVGIYIGGAARACAQPNLTASWLRSIASTGWKVTPIYVGLQAPCSSFANRITYGREWDQGRDAALDAIARAQALGLGAGSDIFFDMESYPQSAQCSGSVRAFLSSWTSTLHYNGYSSGVYSSASTGIRDLALGFAQPGYVPPDKIWIARWNGVPDVYSHDAYVSDNLWAPYSRIHQYLGGHVETHGGVSINIDSNMLDTDPNRGSPVGQFDGLSTGPGTVTAHGWALDPEAGTGPILVQMYLDGRTQTVGRADQPRPDVGAAFPAAGNDHGYSVTMEATPGRHDVCLYAINVGPGSSTLLGCRSVVVPSADPFGQIDTVTTALGKVTATGWAIDPNTSDPILVQMYVDGRTQTVARADRARPDVGAAYPGYGSAHGYSVTLPSDGGQHTVCLYAINTGPGASTLLGCRVVTVPPPNPIGNLESVSAGPGTISAAGWTIDPDTSDPIIVQMYVDGREYSLAWANGDRPDVGAAYPEFGSRHGFRMSMAAGPGSHTVCLYGINTGPGASALLGCRVVVVPSADPFGSIESVTVAPGTVTAHGWAIDPDTPDPILVQMYIDGRDQTLAWARGPRPDVAAVYPTAGANHGYGISMTTTRGRHTACVYAINTGPGASALLGCRIVDVP